LWGVGVAGGGSKYRYVYYSTVTQLMHIKHFYVHNVYYYLTLEILKHISSVPEADAMTNTPSHEGAVLFSLANVNTHTHTYIGMLLDTGLKIQS
jgi:hypothetical protein